MDIAISRSPLNGLAGFIHDRTMASTEPNPRFARFSHSLSPVGSDACSCARPRGSAAPDCALGKPGKLKANPSVFLGSCAWLSGENERCALLQYCASARARVGNMRHMRHLWRHMAHAACAAAPGQPSLAAAPQPHRLPLGPLGSPNPNPKP